MKKIIFFLIIAAILGITIPVSCASCKEEAVMEESRVYEVTSEVISLDVELNFADFQIIEGESFSVESNLKFLTVTQKDGTLEIVDEAKVTSKYENPVLTLTVPKNASFKEVSISTGESKLTASSIVAKRMKLRLGAGDVSIGRLDISQEIDIFGGAGKINVDEANLSDLTLELGLGDLNMKARIRGSSDMVFGVGRYSLTLIGGKDLYTVDVEKGVGIVKIDGETVDGDGEIGDGDNYIEIVGGAGAIDVKFE